MHIMPNYGVAFTHIPKTGGSWVVHVMRQLGRVEMETRTDGTHAKHTVPPETGPRPRFIFTIVREPTSWLQSYWRFQMGSNWTDWDAPGWFPARPLLECQSENFNEFVKLYLEKHPGFVSRVYSWYVGDDGGNVNFIGRTATIRTSLKQALRLGGVPFNDALIDAVPPLNASGGEYPHLDPQLAQQVMDTEPVYNQDWFYKALSK